MNLAAGFIKVVVTDNVRSSHLQVVCLPPLAMIFYVSLHLMWLTALPDFDMHSCNNSLIN